MAGVRGEDTGLCTNPETIGVTDNKSISEPILHGYFSLDTDRMVKLNASQLRYFVMPPPRSLDLNKGIRRAIKRSAESYDERLDHLLEFIFENQKQLIVPSCKGQPLRDVDIVTYRGVMRHIMNIPYEDREDLRIFATLYKGTIYISKNDTPEAEAQRSTMTERDKVMTAYGYKFEQYCTSENPYKAPNTDADVDENAEFSCVFKTDIAQFKVMYGAEMDAVVAAGPIPMDKNKCCNVEDLRQCQFVELKCSRSMRRSTALSYNFRRHLSRKWWCQTYLAKIPDIWVGHRIDTGMVIDMEKVNVADLVTFGKEYWNPNVCIAFLENFLKKLSEIVVVDCPYTTVQIDYNCRSKKVTYMKHDKKSQHSFIPDFYIKMMENAIADQGLCLET